MLFKHFHELTDFTQFWLIVGTMVIFAIQGITLYNIFAPPELVYDCSQLENEKLIKYMEQCNKNYPAKYPSHRKGCEERYTVMMCKPTVGNK